MDDSSTSAWRQIEHSGECYRYRFVHEWDFAFQRYCVIEREGGSQPLARIALANGATLLEEDVRRALDFIGERFGLELDADELLDAGDELVVDEPVAGDRT